ncbi:TlpA family protein disulfide reductase [Desulforhopalus singaporensis]|uniref:Thiol-disulfide isomerase or thioredoxin n=1 Tax=Desulforhopalus singaporensis TaxID=91360 RepID=A0A1H0NCS2_9BACT|nr:TlpA disulfide reductase family protein [Desulforhopalus singaporensis]SDO90443.1 Thiol-disulfide isomerase or thioredoxin [Desulforhopalus singaporensis]
MKKISSSVICCLFTVIFLFGSTTAGLAATKMPTFSLESVSDGKKINSSFFTGKVLLLTFFATWCPPCAAEVPVLNELQQKYGRDGFSVVGLSVDQQGVSTVAEFVEEKRINYPVLMAGAGTARDFGGIYGIPVAFLVNRAGNVVKKYTGYVGHQVLDKDVRSLLN